MSNQKNSVGEVQQAIKQGAVTREYKADVVAGHEDRVRSPCHPRA